MSDFEDKLSSILSDPESMAQIMSLAQSISGGSEPKAQAKAQAKAEESGPDLGKLMELLAKSDMGSQSRYAGLLTALKPYLKTERQQRLEKAIRISKLSKVAKLAVESGMIGEL